MKISVSQVEPQILASTNVILGPAGTFISPVFDIRGYTIIAGFAYSDQGSAANGFVIQQAADIGDFNLGFFTVSVDTIIGGDTVTNAFVTSVVAPFGRVVYTNGLAAQTVFRLYVMSKLGAN